MDKWTSLRIRRKTYHRLLKYMHELEGMTNRRIYFWELLEALMDAWDLLEEDDKKNIAEAFKGKVVAGEVPIS